MKILKGCISQIIRDTLTLKYFLREQNITKKRRVTRLYVNRLDSIIKIKMNTFNDNVIYEKKTKNQDLHWCDVRFLRYRLIISCTRVPKTTQSTKSIIVEDG